MKAHEAESERRHMLYAEADVSICSECGGPMAVITSDGALLLRCSLDHTHQGHRRRPTLTQLHDQGVYIPYASENIEYRRRMQLEQRIGRSLEPHHEMGSRSLITEDIARAGLLALWPNASSEAVAKAVMICSQHRINPLLPNMVHIIHFDSKTGPGNDVVVLGINAKRCIASDKTTYGFLDGPRAMSDDEVKAIGEDSKSRLWVTVTLQTPDGSRYPGYGYWPKNVEPYGSDKGNSKFNMASYRAESNALARLAPMPAPGAMVVDGHVYLDTGEETGVDLPPPHVDPPPPPSSEVVTITNAQSLIDLAAQAGINQADFYNWIARNASNNKISTEGEAIDIILRFSATLFNQCKERLEKRLADNQVPA